MKKVILGVVAMTLLWTWGVYGAQRKKGSQASSKSPITITAKEMEANAKKGWVIFKGAVKAVRDKLTIHADKLEVFLTKDNKIDRILALGNVKVEQGKRVITSQEAEYNVKKDVIEFRGNPKAWEGENLVQGEKMLYYPKEDRSVVVGGKGRVNAIIFPKGEKKGEAGSFGLGKELQR
jgi:lipopolysaccharide export system protein LptA